MIPKTAPYGKFFWRDASNGKLDGLLGRQSLASVVNQRRSSFSCGATCEYQAITSLYLTGFGGNILVIPYGQTWTGDLYEDDLYQGYDVHVPKYYSDYSATITSSDEGVFTVAGSGSDASAVVLTGAGLGSANLGYPYLGQYYQIDPDAGNCVETDDSGTDGGPVSVTPTVTIPTPTTTTLTAGAVTSTSTPKQYMFTATGNPTGGQYTWTSSGSSLTLTNTTTANVSAVGLMSATPTLTVNYTLNGQNATPATTAVTVLKADSIKVVDDSTATAYACPNNTTTPYRYITYEIESAGTTVTDAILAKENVPAVTDSCGRSVSTGSGGFNTLLVPPMNGIDFTDRLYTCPQSVTVSCAFSFASQQWQQKNADGSYTSIGTVGAISVNSTTGATVAGHSPSQDTTGTIYH